MNRPSHFISIADQPAEQIQHVLDVAFDLRDQRRRGGLNAPVLAGKTLALLFEKPSLRTRVSFEQAMFELGGHTIVLGQHEVGLGRRESVADVARVLSGMVHGIAARVFDHDTLAKICAHSRVPTINMLSDWSHPCQALADVMTIMDEFGRDLKGRTLAFVGDGNNVARSLALICAKLGLNFVLASPPEYCLEDNFADRYLSGSPSAAFRMTADPREAVHEADVIYTDTFVSMGQENQETARLDSFSSFQVNAELLASAPSHAVVLHCLPAHRGVEITDEVMDGPRSRVFQEAQNRLHAQKGLLAVLMGGH